MTNFSSFDSKEPTSQHIRRLLDVLQDSLSRANQVHSDFLRNQAQVLQTLAAISNYAKSPIHTQPEQQAVITKDQLQEFGTGSIAKCFGPDFAILDGRKSPRIPNGDLLMMDRVISISGQRGDLNSPASIVTEFDVAADAWFINENTYPGIPLGILLEIALQPCGILSAWLGTSLSLPADVNIFRNLDGELSFSANPVLSGATIRNHARLLNSVASGGMLIQKYAFELSVGELVFLSGESSFGYFRQTAMDNQAGLDGKNAAAPQSILQNQGQIDLALKSFKKITSQIQHFDLVDRLTYENQDINHQAETLAGEKVLSGKEWFYTNHFFQDPVMPGSLGVEAIVQSMWAAIRHLKLDAKFHLPVLDFSNSLPLEWKYRGQVTPANKKVNFVIHLKNSPPITSIVHLLADAEFWVDNLKIYSIRNISMTLREGQAA